MKTGDLNAAFDLLCDSGVEQQHDLASVLDLAETLGENGDVADGVTRIVTALQLLTECVAGSTKNKRTIHAAGALLAARTVLEGGR